LVESRQVIAVKTVYSFLAHHVPDESGGDRVTDHLVDGAVQMFLPQLRRYNVDMKIDALYTPHTKMT